VKCNGESTDRQLMCLQQQGPVNEQTTVSISTLQVHFSALMLLLWQKRDMACYYREQQKLATALT